MPEPIVSLRGFGYRYSEAASPALHDLSLEIAAGEYVVVTGTSGCGKSTLLRACCGLVPHFYGGEVSGSLVVGGMSVREHGPSDLAAVCGTLFQDPESQVVMGGVRAEIAMTLEHRGDSPAALARAVEETALALGIAHLLERRTDTLSGGELQRVALAAALAHRPALVVLDEPTSQLDPVAGDELMSHLRRLNEEWGTTVVVAEHRLERCIGASDRVIALDSGRLVCDAAPGEFLGWAAVERPELATPAARLFELAGLGPAPASVKQARSRLHAGGLLPAVDARAAAQEGEPSSGRPRLLARRRGARPPAALELRGAWFELSDGPAILRGVDLRLEPGERAVLMGRNGAGKSTLLRLARGLAEPTRGAVDRSGAAALLLQNPGDYLVQERVGDEAGAEAVRAAGLEGREDANPRDLSGGERQRLALEIVLEGAVPAAVLLDEPTRGMDRARKRALGERLGRAASGGVAVLVATHDTEFAAELAERVILMGEGVVIADGPAGDVLAGGWYFATEVARVLGGAGGALTPEDGARLLQRELVT